MATEKALGDASLYDTHQQLVEMRRRLRGTQAVGASALDTARPGHNSRGRPEAVARKAQSVLSDAQCNRACLACADHPQAVASYRSHHERLTTENAALERDYHRFQKRRKLQTQLAVGGSENAQGAGQGAMPSPPPPHPTPHTPHTHTPHCPVVHSSGHSFLYQYALPSHAPIPLAAYAAGAKEAVLGISEAG